MKMNKDTKERTIENFLNKYHTYKIAIKNCQQQLDYMLPSLTAKYDSDGTSASYYIANNTEKVALDRITSKKALDLVEEIEQYKLIISSIDNASAELNERQKEFLKLRYFNNLKMHEIKDHMFISDEKTLYRIRRSILDKFIISLGSLISLN